MKCKICGEKFENRRALATHLQAKHKIKSKDYITQYEHGGSAPGCAECGAETRFEAMQFKKYCSKHAKLAMSKGGKKGGQAEAWSKGLTKHDDQRLMNQSLRATGEGNHFYGKKHSEESLQKLKSKKRISEKLFNERIGELQERNIEVITSYCDYLSRQHQYLDFKCSKCGTSDLRTLQALERGSLCKVCHPQNSSQAELEVKNFIKSLNINFLSNSRNIIPPCELDIYCPNHKFAIEYNGLYWHSEANFDLKNLTKDYHANKTNLCNQNNISLMHIFSDEWRDKKEICKSMIRHRLGLSENKIFARKCKIEIHSDHLQATKFFNESHISGYAQGKIYFNLMYENEVVGMFSLRKAFHKKKYENMLEIGRYACKLNTSIPGGLSRLLKKVIEYAKTEKYAGIITYADKRFAEAGSYEQNGFEYIGETPIDYWYTDGVLRYNRFGFRAQDGKSESEIARERKCFRIYGCGNKIYQLLT